MVGGNPERFIGNNLLKNVLIINKKIIYFLSNI